MSPLPMTWQDAVLAHFTPKRDAMLLAIDPDGLLRDDVLLAAIQNANYDVLELANEVAFRNMFERSYRSHWDDGEARHVVVVVHTTDAEQHIPYDLWRKSRRVELSAGMLFPNLNALVVRRLDNEYYDALYTAHRQLVTHGEKLIGERQTVEFILRVVFGLEPAVAADPARWVEFLIGKHYSKRQVPPELEKYLVSELLPLAQSAGLRAEFVDNATAFFAWLGEQWAQYVASIIGQSASPPIDFSSMRLRPLLAYLFAQGLVARAFVSTSLPPGREWLAMGLAVQSGAGPRAVRENSMQTIYNLRARLARFANPVTLPLPIGVTDLRDWLGLASEWSEIVYRCNSLSSEAYGEVQSELAMARQALDGAFWEFICSRYSAVGYYEDNKGPVNVATINRWLSQQCSTDQRLVLVCFDGLALDQWRLLREYFETRLAGLTFEENATYALAPTLTSVSRQALFAGRLPAEFPDTLTRTDKDAERWKAFWINHGVRESQVEHCAVKPKDPDLSQVEAIVQSPNRRLGILVNLFDDVMHATEGMPATADKRVYYDTLQSHLDHGYLDRLLKLLLASGYRVFVCADHGNIAGVGTGLTPPKALVDKTARRVAIFDEELLAREYADAHALRLFRTKILPADMYPVYPPGNGLFAPFSNTQVSHGGLSIEELAVPFIEIKRVT